jgi:hypothetical protein
MKLYSDVQYVATIVHMRNGRTSLTLQRSSPRIVLCASKKNTGRLTSPHGHSRSILSRVGGCFMTYRLVFDWMIGFIVILFAQLGITGNYSATADLRPLQFTVTHALGFSVFTSRILATDL